MHARSGAIDCCSAKAPSSPALPDLLPRGEKRQFLRHVWAVADRQRRVAHQEVENGIQLSQCGTPLHHALVVFLESRAVLDPSHRWRFAPVFMAVVNSSRVSARV